ncbi:MAG: hypothetical protein Q4A74_09450, partial [Cardiobacteriaceae bacterium]|nr:hypothetical protein [Cardiobacteriaceae bacterium]
APEGYAAFADVNKNNKFDTNDIPLRTVVLNTPTRADMRYLFDNLDANYAPVRRGSSEYARAAAYLPNGSFLRADFSTANGLITANPANSIIKIILTDLNPQDKQKNRAQVMLLDGS